MQGRKPHSGLLAASLLTLSLTIHADTSSAAPTGVLEHCTAATERELAGCVTAALDNARKAAQAHYAQLEANARIDEPELAALLENELKTWLTFSQAQCEVDTYYSRGGTAYGLYLDACLAEQYDARARRLQQMIENP